jgi:hypothetical protein
MPVIPAIGTFISVNPSTPLGSTRDVSLRAAIAEQSRRVVASDLEER